MINDNRKKVMRLPQAIQRFVPDSSHISIGGFTINRNPMAAVYEIIRQKKRGLHLYAHSNGQGVDELVGGGTISRLEIAYGGSGRFAPTCIRFKKAVQEGRIDVEDYSNFQMTLRFMAGALGVPFLPTRSGMGSDILAKWGFSEETRSADPKLPDQKACVMITLSETGPIPARSSWFRPSCPMSPSSTLRKHPRMEPSGSAGLPSQMWNRPKLPSTSLSPARSSWNRMT